MSKAYEKHIQFIPRLYVFTPPRKRTGRDEWDTMIHSTWLAMSEEEREEVREAEENRDVG